MTRSPFLAVLLIPLTTACGSDDSGGDDGPTYAGKTYLLNVPENSWTGGVGQDIGPYVPQFVMKVEGNPAHYDIQMGAARNGVQEMCNPTAQVSAQGTPPAFTLGPTDFPLYIRHEDEPIAVEATIYDLTISNVLPDGDTLAEEGTLTGIMDFREVYPLLTLIQPEPTPDLACQSLIDAGVGECETCSDGEKYCLTLKAVYLGAEEAPDITLQPVADVDSSCLELE